MADLPKDRYEEAPPFTYCAVDMFGLFTVRVKSLNSLLQTHEHSLDKESLQTLMTETEAIINS